MTWKTATCNDSPNAWLGEAEGIDPGDRGLQALAQGMTGACTQAQ